MLTSTERLDTTTPAWYRSWWPASANVRAARNARTDATSYDPWFIPAGFGATGPENSTAPKFLIVRASVRRDPDRTSRLRDRVLSYRAERPGELSITQAVNDALRFIDLVPATATLPYVALADDGEVNFFWRQEGLLIDIGFVGDGMMHYYVSDEAQGVDSDASVPFSGRSLPRDIEATIPRSIGELRSYP